MPESLTRVAILGTGFGAFNLAKNLDRRYDVTVVSPRNHFLFTPLLPSTTVGTIEFRSIIEPIRHARTTIRFFHAFADGTDTESRTVLCRGAAENDFFEIRFEILVIAVGAISNTYGVPGVAEHALYLKELGDARALRQRIIGSFERANLPAISPEERRRLLHFVICGGGPTGVEFAAELHDFFLEDLQKSYPHLVDEARITLVEASKHILGSFDDKLRRYALDIFRRQRISVLTGSPVVGVEAAGVTLEDGTKLDYGLLLWSTGNGPTPFVQHALLPKDGKSRIMIDDYFQVPGLENIYAVGDCSVNPIHPLPATAQVAQQQGKYLAHILNRRLRRKEVKPFHYRDLGMLAYIGGNKALADLQAYKGRGWTTWLFWRSAYLSRIVSIKNKILVLFDWLKTRAFGRDTSQF